MPLSGRSGSLRAPPSAFAPMHVAYFADKNFTRRDTSRPPDRRLQRVRFQIYFCTSLTFSTTALELPLTISASSSLNVRLSAVLFRKYMKILLYLFDQSNLKPEDTTGASGRALGGTTELARAGWRANITVRPENTSSVCSSRTRFSVSPEAQTSESLCKSVESKTRTYYKRIASKRTVEWQGGIRQCRMPT